MDNPFNMQQQQQGYTCGRCSQFVVPGIYPHTCYIPPVQVAPQGWRCTCMVFVIPGEEHRCFYKDILAVLERIAVQLEKPQIDTGTMAAILSRGGV